ncbi:MAG TPA: flagellar biosynthetic protein FliR [Candidatus Acidoferrales bacterium]|jgi:flagellar biosynthetic protein FliR|nr:flagellar biosynthetic protein FliR [Candidatus Acidoferrales bacterium]
MIQRLLMPALLLGLRVAGLMSFAPFLGSTSISARFKAVLTLAFTVFLYPVCAPQISQAASLTSSNWAGMVLSESCLGLLMGLTVQFVFEGAQFAGQFASIQMGFSLVTILDPQTQADTPVMSVFFQTVGLFLFLQLDVHHWMIRAIAKSYALVPVGSVTISEPLVREFFHVAGSMFIVGVEIAGPIVLATMVVDLSLKFLGKVSPQIPVMLMGVSIKFLLGMAVLITAVGCWPSFFESRFAGALGAADHLLHLAR